MTTYLVTGGTGFLGQHLLRRLLARDDCERVHALVRAASVDRLRAMAASWPHGERLSPLIGDLTASALGLSDESVADLTGAVDHVVHLAAIYDMTADEAANRAANVDGTARVVTLANTIGAGCLHHVSSVAVAGDHRGRYAEDQFDVGQRLTSPYHATKFEAEALVRERAGTPWRVYRPAIVVGDSATGEMDKIDGPYYLFGLLGELGDANGLTGGVLKRTPLILPDLGDTNIVPVDYVADAMSHLMHAEGLDGRAFHLVNPKPQRIVEVYNALAKAAGAPRAAVSVPRGAVRSASRLAAPLAGVLGQLPGVEAARDLTLRQFGIPPEILPHLTFRTVFDATATRTALHGSGIKAPRFEHYADALWAYWRKELDPNRARRRQPGGPLAGRRVVITGASSGIGRATALQVARKGGVPLLLARRTMELEQVRAEIERAGGQAHVYSCDITSAESIDAVVKQMVAEHPGIDMLVNNAGRSIRRSIKLSYDRVHDFERTMAINYFGAVRLTMRLLPHMAARRFGHIVNISSIGVQTNPPRFSAYVASKSALDAFSRIAASETYGDGITFTTVHMPLVRTPMIRPTRIYNAFPALSSEQAGAMVTRALIQRPKHVGTPLGTLGAVSYTLAPRLVDVVLHLAYEVFPDSAAAAGEGEAPPTTSLSNGAKAFMRLLPGVHW
ncbi:MAG: SDR family oxidoreductase [Micromonosporaceae bacterium]|nr:SDR family oxidoreductase [Micromonosporaceae bacterium]